MTNNIENNKSNKCYNSVSCILSVLIIAFVLGSIGWDIFVSKPEIRNSIEEIRIEVKDIRGKLDNRLQKDSIFFSTQEIKIDTVNK